MRNPWFRSRMIWIAPAGATEVPLPDAAAELPPALRNGRRIRPTSTGYAAPEAGWLHPWLHSGAPPGRSNPLAPVFFANLCRFATWRETLLTNDRRPGHNAKL